MDANINAPQPKKHRSPAYPSIDLRTAVQKVSLLYDNPRGGIKRNFTHIETAISTMDYKTGSSTGVRAVAAMISYGLLEEIGAGPQRQVKLTRPAIDLQLLAEDDPDRLAILQKMALKPKIFEEIVAHYPGELPNDITIEKYLKVDKQFNPDVVKPIIKNFHLTYDYAKLANLGILSDDEDDSATGQEALDFQEDQGKPSAASQQRQVAPLDEPNQRKERNIRMSNQEEMRTLTIPLPGERLAFLDVPAHASANDFRFMLKFLEFTQDAWGGHPDLRNSARTAPKIRFGVATWHGQETDSLVTVVGYWGEREGRHYVEIEGSNTGVPFDEIEYE